MRLRASIAAGSLFLVLLPAAAALPAKAPAPVRLNTKWTEVHPTEKGPLRVYVRWIELTKTTWRASVGFTNKTSVRVEIDVQQGHQPLNPTSPLTFWWGPSLTWTSYIPAGQAGGRGWIAMHTARASRVSPRYPRRLAVGQAWYGIFAGPLAKVPTDRLLRIGFGEFGGDVPNSFSTFLQTDHQFKLPKLRT